MEYWLLPGKLAAVKSVWIQISGFPILGVKIQGYALGLPFQCLCSLLNISLKHKTWLHLSLVKVMYIIMKSRVLDFYFPPSISNAVESIVIHWNENTFCSLCLKQWFIFFPVVMLVKQTIVTPKMSLAYSSDICQNFHLFGLSFYQRSWIFSFHKS